MLMSLLHRFVDIFAQINVMKFSMYNRDSWKILVKTSGNSRAEPTPFKFHCKKGKCNYQTDKWTSFRYHFQTCSGLDKPDRQFICNLRGNDFQPEISPMAHEATALRTIRRLSMWTNIPCSSKETGILPTIPENA